MVALRRFVVLLSLKRNYINYTSNIITILISQSNINVTLDNSETVKSDRRAACRIHSLRKNHLTAWINDANAHIDPEDKNRESGALDSMTNSLTKSVIHQVKRQCTVVTSREESSSDEQVLAQFQETLFWGEDFILKLAAGQHAEPLTLAVRRRRRSIVFYLYLLRTTKWFQSAGDTLPDNCEGRLNVETDAPCDRITFYIRPLKYSVSK
ncbi:hypothetical protein EVAR_68180_1 [Eumeta japonica]|uniref:Uncharacterized protein n=1 Tax=Eumeta variegata TaxID=151549 RepID=A0A4C2A020_EUMVA|nr:hypothetical protein EVAR_68180_1 [Eumeta japonica]